MPQDLLDLIPRPVCDNCNFYESGVECSICNEFFCYQCWDQVHYGARRKEHEFRALYDYYGKRLDYGEGDFPCKWPSEVVQDEVQGWMLRVAPTRDPVAVHGTWEEYTDATDLGGQRTFYFNRQTFEATYDQPEELQSLKNGVTGTYANSGITTALPEAGGNYIGYQYNASGQYQYTGTAEANAYNRQITAGGNNYANNYNNSSSGITGEEQGGYYDESGNWVYAQTYGISAGGDGGYYDSNGSWVHEDHNAGPTTDIVAVDTYNRYNSDNRTKNMRFSGSSASQGY